MSAILSFSLTDSKFSRILLMTDTFSWCGNSVSMLSRAANMGVNMGANLKDGVNLRLVGELRSGKNGRRLHAQNTGTAQKAGLHSEGWGARGH
jgi:hypothetical protein